MKLSRIRFAFTWRIALILALLLCLPSFGFWAWLRWEVPPLQRYYLIAYWHSSKHADQPGARTQIRWLMETAPGRKRQWLFALDVTKGSQSELPLELSPFAVEQGWTGIERTPVESVDSAELEKLLREDFYDGESFSRLVNEPLVYAVAAWLIVAYLAFVMKGDIGYEWRQLRRAVAEPQWSSNYGRDWPENRGGLVARIRSRIAPLIRENKTQLEWSAISHRSVLKSSQIQKHFARVTDRLRWKFGVMFLLHSNSRLNSLHPPQNHRLRDVVSSPDRLHRMQRIRNQNRGMNRSGLISEATSDVLK
jgi:hypothetical protein